MGTGTSMDLNANGPTYGDINTITDTHIDRCTHGNVHTGTHGRNQTRTVRPTWTQAHLDQNINPHTDTWRHIQNM
jgi:hypothetical protein